MTIAWVERGTAPPPANPDIALLERAAAAQPGIAALQARIGTARLNRGDYAGAASAFAEADRLDPAEFESWAPYAAALFRLRDYARIVQVCDRGLAAGGPETLRYLRGRAYRRLGRFGESIADFEQLLAAGPDHFPALLMLLRPLSRETDGGPLLARCDSLPPAYRDSAAARGYRAIALSRLGREDEARALVDCERHVALKRFEPPAEFGGIEAFNAMLAEEILRHPPVVRKHDGFEISYNPPHPDSAAFDALAAFARGAIQAYVDRLDAMGLAGLMPPPPTRASLGRATGVLYREGSNGEHLHPGNYVSSVYYVRVPADISAADDDRGALLMGKCSDTTRGYQPSWGVRAIRPEAGTLAIFPAHFFHDVAPSLSDAPRIVVAQDLRPESG